MGKDDSSGSEVEDYDKSDDYEDNSKTNSKEKVVKEKKFIEEKKIDFSFDNLSPNKENEENNSSKKQKKKKSKIDEKKRRRRSSARFLHLSGNRNQEDNEGQVKEHDHEKLSQMYKKTLR